MSADTLLHVAGWLAVWLACGLAAVAPIVLHDWYRCGRITVGNIFSYFLVVSLGGFSLGATLLAAVGTLAVSDTVVFRKKRK